jgi:phage baseplate assembly protein V
MRQTPMSEDYYSGRNNSARFEMNEFFEDKGVSYAKVRGLDGETFDRVMRIQQHGFASVPAKGSHALGVAMGGRRDSLMLLGGEHAKHRPRNLGDGNTALYNADGTIWKMVGETANLTAKKSVSIESKGMKFKCGNCTMTFDEDGLHITGGTIRHDGHDIGKTHLHLNASGPGLSGTPQ